MRCPACGSLDDRVVDSRSAEDGQAIRRRRECLACARRYTTFERAEEAPLVVVKRNGSRQSFDRSKLLAGVRAATKNCALDGHSLESLATEVEESLRSEGDVPSEAIGIAVLERLRKLDGVAYVRFASVYKGFTDPEQFEREVRLLAKASAPKAPA